MNVDPYRRTFALREATALLAATPRTLEALVGGLPDGWTDAREAEATWSPAEVVAHLIHCERTDWMPRLRIILEHGEARAFDPFDRDADLQQANPRSVHPLLDELTELRAHNVATLKALELTDADLERRGTHPEFGPVTARQLLATWVAHDFDHVMQIARVVGRQYTEEVGPWSAYLRVISGRQG
jgi:transposase